MPNEFCTTTEGFSPKLEPGAVLGGQYRLECKAGRGGMGEIWKAYDEVGKRDVALKFVPKELQSFEREMKRVQESFDTIQALHHQLICPTLAMKDDQYHGFYIVMQWLEGKSLDDYRNSGHSLSSDEIQRILKDAAEALDYAHGKGVVHRDIKPSNIFLCLSGDGSISDVQLIDFGLAAAIRESMTCVSQVPIDTSGTRPYMPPEQWRGRQPTAATDQYSLAVAAYELYSGGKLPFSGTDFEILRAAVLNESPERIPGVPESVNAALLKALSKDGADRFSSCSEFVNALSGGYAYSAPSGKGHHFLSSFPGTALALLAVCAGIIGMFCLFGLRDDKTADFPEPVSVSRSSGQEDAVSSVPAAEPVSEPVPKPEPEPVSESVSEPVPKPEPEPVSESVSEPVSKPVSEPEPESGEVSKPPVVPQSEPSPGDIKTITVNRVAYNFRWCPPGEFMMGSPESEEGRDDDETLHCVKLSKGFWLLETPVTQEMWESVMKTTVRDQYEKGVDWGEVDKIGSAHPMYFVNWEESAAFCEKLSELSGQLIRLPTESEWEYACRAGTETPFSFGSVLNGDKANGDGNYPYGTNRKGKYLKETSPVKSYSPNAWGLYDMHGNVWEWCSDWYGDYPSGAVTDPTGPETGSLRVSRGGGWSRYGGLCRSANRDCYDPSFRSCNLGFRPLLVPR